MKKLFALVVIAAAFASCGGGKTEEVKTDSAAVAPAVDTTKKADSAVAPAVDSTKADSTKK